MIFVTVGTHEQQFNRLVAAMDALVADGEIAGPVFIQTGYCTYEPKHCEWRRFIPAPEMKKRMADAGVVVTHGGPSSFIEAMAVGKVPVVVPRSAEYGEHVNNHQADFVHEVANRVGGIVSIEDVADLPSAIGEASRLSMEGGGFESNNARFCRELARLIGTL